MLNLSGYKQEQKNKDVVVLLANLFNAHRMPVSIPMADEYWHRPQYNTATPFTKDLIKQFETLDLITMKPGYHTETASRITRILATDKLYELCPRFADSVEYSPVNLVELRDWSGKLLPYKDTARTWEVKDKLKVVNAVNVGADIRRGSEVYKAYLVAVYKAKFTLYGRLHTRGYHHVQGLSGNQRAELTINSDPVIELDFSALHPNLLYSDVGIQCQVDPYQVVHSDPLARPYLKHLLLCLLNSKDFTQAERAGNYWLRNHPQESKHLKGHGITRAKPLLEAFIEAHEPISQYFCTGKETGLKIMNKDSKIALDIVHDFAKQGIPILSVHDSFIVQQQYEDQLRETMQRRYKQHTKGFEIQIK